MKEKNEKTFGYWMIEPEEIAVTVRYGPEWRYFYLQKALIEYGYIMSPQEVRKELDNGNLEYKLEKRPFTITAKGFDPIGAISDSYQDTSISNSVMDGWIALGFGNEGDVKRKLIADEVVWLKRFLSHPQSKRGTSPNSLQNLTKSSKRKGKKGKKGKD